MTNEARKFNARPLKLDPAQLSELDDTELVALLLERHEGAWRELVRRYDRDVRGIVGKRLCKAMQTILASDAIDDVIGDLYLRLVERDMRRLRVWLRREERGSLVAWLGLLASGIAVDHIRAAFVRDAASLEGDDAGDDDEATLRDRRKRSESDANPNRGGAWIAAERAACIGLEEDQPKKKRRNRKSNDDL